MIIKVNDLRIQIKVNVNTEILSAYTYNYKSVKIINIPIIFIVVTLFCGSQ